MKMLQGAVVAVAGVMILSGCARDERWTLDGSTPSALNDQKPSEMAAAKPAPKTMTAELSAPTPTAKAPAAQKAVAPKPVGPVAYQGMVVTEKDGFCMASNNTDSTIAATFLITPGMQNGGVDAPHKIRIMVPAGATMKVGRTKDASTGTTWTYELQDTDKQ